MTTVSSTPVIREKWCKSCGLCIEFCPKEVFGSDQFGKPIIEYPEKCIGCLQCSIRCPALAIDIIDKTINF